MTKQWDAVDGYIVDLLVGEDEVLVAALDESRANGLPEIAVAPNQGKFLMLLARAMGARRILEIGTLGGYSTIWLARGVVPAGGVVTLELLQKHADVALANIARAGLSEFIDVRVGPALEELDALIAEGAEPFDLVFIDADKETYPEYFERSLALSRPGTVIVADNVVRDGEVVDPSTTDERVLAVRRFMELVAAEPRVTSTAIQTVGTKGYDGFAFALVTD